MRLGFKEVNVGQRVSVPQRGCLARLYLWACERLYDELAWQYDLVSWLVSAGQWRRWQAGIWSEVRGHAALELGCGTGAMLAQGVARGLKMVGVDCSPRMLAVAHKRMIQARGTCQLVLGDGRTLPVADGSFDTVMATFPAGYILNVATLAEARRVLRDNGRLVILGLWVDLHLGGIKRLLPLFYGRPTEEMFVTLEQRVEAAGFRVRWVEQREGFVTVGVLVAERQ